VTLDGRERHVSAPTTNPVARYTGIADRITPAEPTVPETSVLTGANTIPPARTPAAIL